MKQEVNISSDKQAHPSLVCLPLQHLSRCEQVVETINTHKSSYDIFEIWLDLLVDLDIKWLEKIRAAAQDRLIVLFRRPALAPIQMDASAREVIVKSVTHSTVLVDVDYYTDKEGVAILKDHLPPEQQIFSYHNYEFTPDYRTLERIYDTLLSNGALLVKLATMCESRYDALRLLELLVKASALPETRPIIMGMGYYGALTRLVGMHWGNRINFIPLNSKSSSAPGQLSYDELDMVRSLAPYLGV